MHHRSFLQRRLVEPLLAQLRQGVSPRELALCLALGATIGLVPVLGVSTLLCALAALVLRLNMPAIQLVNYLLAPLQLILIIPLLRFGERLAGAPPFPVTLESARALFSQGAVPAVQVLATAIAHATLAWLVLAPLLLIGLFRGLEPIIRHLQRTR
jgi:uncharacterized protein (DUF2062 family)